MKLATFNLYQFAAPPFFWYEPTPHSTYSLDQWQSKCEWIIHQLQKMDADIVTFQEVFSIKALQQLCETAGYSDFLTVDQPKLDPKNPNVYLKPIVAIASRFPCKTIESVELNDASIPTVDPDESFAFSRQPIRATFQTQALGEVMVYAIHLKSKRPDFDPQAFPKDLAWNDRVKATVTGLSYGHLAAQWQRGLEAHCLYQDILQVLSRKKDLPILVMGDLNDTPDSTVLRSLTLPAPIQTLGKIPSQDWPETVSQLLYDYQLADSQTLVSMAPQPETLYTHIHHGKRQILDFILVSNSLNANNPHRIAEVSSYRILNQHLQEAEDELALCSDHGQVVIQLTPHPSPPEATPQSKSKKNAREAPPSPSKGKHPITRLKPRPRQRSRPSPTPTPNPPTRLDEARQAFIQKAGGVFKAHKSYEQWDGTDKWENFWSFFFDTDHGWVKSVYGSIPVDVLRQKQRHSIEHVIPKSFLVDYLLKKQTPTSILNGATVNPFNFAPSERRINKARSNFPFDLEGDRVVRPFHITLNPRAGATTGLDHHNEWVIPSQTRGDIARAILYMVLIYGIDEQYNSHIKTLIHWAKVDTPSAWEIAYNRWVEQKHRIRNPFIDKPQKALKLLTDEKLMNSPILKQ